jgi:hypothetical protein
MSKYTAWAVLCDGKPTGDVIYAETEEAALARAREFYTPSSVSVRAES